MWELIRKEELRIASKFLVWVTGYMVAPFTKIKNKGARKAYGQGDDFSFIHAAFEVPERHSYCV